MASGQLDAGFQLFNYQANLVLILSTHLRDERLSQSCSAPVSNQGSVLWQHEARATGLFLKKKKLLILYSLKSIQYVRR